MKVYEIVDLFSRRKGENAQQVIDLSFALKTAEKELTEKQKRIDSLEAQLISLTEDIKFTEAKSLELEETNQLLKVDYVFRLEYCTGNTLSAYCTGSFMDISDGLLCEQCCKSESVRKGFRNNFPDPNQ